MKKALHYFSHTELGLWGSSILLILVSFFLFDGESTLTLAASLIGVTSLLLNAKGNPVGQVLMIVFSILYGIISYSFSYYGEMMTYLGMTLPMAVLALISWLRHPYQGNRAAVKVGSLGRWEPLFLLPLTALVTFAFFLLLKRLDTANLTLSTISVTTSFLAVYLTFRRSPLYALAYAANDTVLILLWCLASREEPRYLSVIVCFVTFLLHDGYGFFSWQKMKHAQAPAKE